MTALIQALWDGFRALLYPRGAACFVCAAPLGGSQEELLCPDCLRSLRARRRENPALSVPAPLDGGFAAFSFGGISRDLIHRLKYDGLIRLGPLLACEMRFALPGDADALVPIPLYVRREAARGFNQSAVLAGHLALQGAPHCLNALKRVRPTRQQALLSRRQRQKNLRHSMAACADVCGKRLLLIDDVFTTGSTAAEAARALKAAGASWVGILTFAKA